jgi:hypothetical protein
MRVSSEVRMHITHSIDEIAAEGLGGVEGGAVRVGQVHVQRLARLPTHKRDKQTYLLRLCLEHGVDEALSE